MIRDFIKSSLEKKNTIMLITSLSFIVGIASYFNNCELIFGILFTIFAIIIILKTKLSFRFLLVWVVVFYLGFFSAYFRIENSDNLAKLAPANLEITGRVISIPNSGMSGKTKFFMAVEKVNGKDFEGKTFVNISDENNDFSMFNVGNIYKINGNLRLPFRASNPSQFDYGKYLRNFDVFTIVYAETSDCEYIKTELPLKWRFMQKLNNVRNRILKTHSKYLKSPNLEILGGVVFGDDAVSPPDYIKDSFTNSGLLHILAASGMNVAFIYGFWFYILSLLKVPYKPRVISGMGVVILYTLMTGLGASVIRAALMLLFVLAGKLIDRDSHSISLLSFVAFLMLLYNPAFLNDVGFQLSFLVTFGIVCTADVIMKRFEGNRIVYKILGALLIPIVAQIWVIPLQMFYFNTISTYSFFANVSIMPFLSVISFGGFVSSVLSVISPIANFVCGIFDFILNYMLTALVWISNFFATLPNSLIETPHPSLLQVFVYYIAVLLATLMIKEGFTKRHLAILGGLIVLFFGLWIRIPDGKLDVIAFDVGNADAFLIKTPEEKYILIDTAKAGYKGSKPQAEFIIRKYLKDRGIKNLELLVVTHFDIDHAGGASELAKNMKVKNILTNSLTDKARIAQTIYKTAKDTKTPILKALDGEVVYEEPNLTLRSFVETYDSDNESSVITLLSYKDFDMLFTGDAGLTALGRIADKMPSKVEVLKVGHHGAANVMNKEYLNRLGCGVSVISTGKNNYGHPNKGTLDILSPTEIYRTDKDNSIKITTDGSNYETYTFNSSTKHYEMISQFQAE